LGLNSVRWWSVSLPGDSRPQFSFTRCPSNITFRPNQPNGPWPPISPASNRRLFGFASQIAVLHFSSALHSGRNPNPRLIKSWDIAKGGASDVPLAQTRRSHQWHVPSRPSSHSNPSNARLLQNIANLTRYTFDCKTYRRTGSIWVSLL